MLSIIKNFYQYYKPYKLLFIADFVCAILVALLELVFPLAVNRVIDEVLPTNNWEKIILACIILLVIYLISAGMTYIVTFYGHNLGVNIERDLRRNLFEKLQHQSFRFFDDNKTGHLLSRMTNDLFDIGEVAHHGPEDLFIAVMTLLGAFGVMYSINDELAIIIFAVVPLLIILAVYFSRKMKSAFSKMYKEIANYNARIENNFSGIRVVQSFAKENYEINLFKQNNEQYRGAKLVAYKFMALNASMSYVLMKLVSLTVLGVGSYFVIHGKMSNGEFVAFIMLSNIFVSPINKINQILELLPKGYAGFSRYLEIMNLKPEIEDLEDAKEVKSVVGDIQYKDVRFSYDGKHDILKGINLDVQAGQTIALVGASGGGKTTLCSVLPRFYEVTGGEVTIDGRNIKEFTLHSLRSHIGIVQQDVFLFDGTIKENIMYGRLDATEEEMYQAIEDAQLTTFISQLPDGIHTFIGERGVKLSGGQKQRLSIARMFLKNPPILILDEATSALDTETERAVQEALERLSKNRTTIVIAHRLATVRHADRIFVIENGQVAESGTHEQLMECEGAYAKLIEAQYM